MKFKSYQKIETAYQRDIDGTKELMIGKFRSPALEELQFNQFEWTEKVDGTNIQVVWDGHTVSFGGRTERSQLPISLYNHLQESFGGETNEELFEQLFGEKEVILYGEGYGEKIQSNGYRNGVGFILFDVNINGIWFNRKDVETIAEAFQIEVVPIIMYGDIEQALCYVCQHPKSEVARQHGFDSFAEGIVGRTKTGLLDKNGNRIIVKMKWNDFKNIKFSLDKDEKPWYNYECK